MARRTCCTFDCGVSLLAVRCLPRVCLGSTRTGTGLQGREVWSAAIDILSYWSYFSREVLSRDYFVFGDFCEFLWGGKLPELPRSLVCTGYLIVGLLLRCPCTPGWVSFRLFVTVGQVFSSGFLTSSVLLIRGVETFSLPRLIFGATMGLCLPITDLDRLFWAYRRLLREALGAPSRIRVGVCVASPDSFFKRASAAFLWLILAWNVCNYKYLFSNDSAPNFRFH